MRNLFHQIYIGGLRSDSDKYDVEEAFAQYGKVLKLHCCYHLDVLKLLIFLLVMGQFLKSKGPECLWDIFENS